MITHLNNLQRHLVEVFTMATQIIRQETILDFLKQDEVQQLLNVNNLDAVYILYEKQISNAREEYASSLTSFLLRCDINPLYYVSTIVYGMFCDCTKEDGCPHHITIASHFDKIPDYTFWGCDVENVTIEDGVKYIRAMAFDSCLRLKNITLPKSISYIDETSFVTMYCKISCTYEGCFVNIRYRFW